MGSKYGASSVAQQIFCLSRCSPQDDQAVICDLNFLYPDLGLGKINFYQPLVVVEVLVSKLLQRVIFYILLNIPWIVEL